MAKIYGNTVGATGGLPKSFLLETEDGVQLVGVTVGEETIFDATDNDVREGKVYASDGGVSTGTKFIPSYHTTNSSRLIKAGSEFLIPLLKYDLYDYTKIQAVICPYNISMSQSVAAEKTILNDKVYPVQSNEILSSLTKDDENKSICFGIINNTDIPYVIKYFTYKEIY